MFENQMTGKQAKSIEKLSQILSANSLFISIKIEDDFTIENAIFSLRTISQNYFEDEFILKQHYTCEEDEVTIVSLVKAVYVDPMAEVDINNFHIFTLNKVDFFYNLYKHNSELHIISGSRLDSLKEVFERMAEIICKKDVDLNLAEIMVVDKNYVPESTIIPYIKLVF